MASPSIPDVIVKKVSNAFFSNDEMVKKGDSPGDLSLILASWLMGGLWLGGNTSLTSTKVIFELNALNKLFQSGNYRIEIPLVEISQVTVKPSLGFKTIQLTSPQGDFKIRVKGAQEFASLIEETIAKAKSGRM